ncbi:uncharacterized protein DUF4148 [Trinickia symbiotica]|uniref:DUF4148 domain-containing protein n=1 Tax=Trinickia symbiotica TaxID=863227 RepID=UPI00036515CA|nr:DUF4148 domain-containing protein [Trinickia symbiotica]PPK45752.1 uncharacterized protein DUF4148 [Trinickia symbiotica]
MKTRLLVAALLAAAVAAPAHAESMTGKTRAQVYEELIEAQRNGLRYITNTSYPDVSRIYAPQAAKRADETLVADAKGPSPAAGAEASGSPARAVHAAPACQGPAFFCEPFFGS